MGSMEISDLQLAAALRLATAALIGLGVGLEREWSGHAAGPEARFAGVRTFLMLGLLGGAAGLLAVDGHQILAGAIAAGGAILSIAAYVMVVRQPGADRDGTTETAAILVVALGALAGAGSWLIAAGAGSVMVLALNEKQRLHGAISHVNQAELRAALQFAVLALVVLPLLPEGPFFGWAALRPRALWMIVLLFCALNFAGFLARRSAGQSRGYLLTGLLGGVISSTAVTIGFARYSRQYPNAAAALAVGVIGACTVLVPRVLVVSAVLNPAVATELVTFLVLAGLIGAAVVAFAWRFGKSWDSDSEVSAPVSWLAPDEKNPLRLWMAIRLAIIFQVALMAVTYVRQIWDVKGLYGTAVVLGLTDVDALTVSMSTPSTNILPLIAARAIAVGILANTFVKLGISVAVGSGRYRLISAGVLLAMAVAIGAALYLRQA
jgi:uncharacterized membrane protein (DUF4010 family)